MFAVGKHSSSVQTRTTATETTMAGFDPR